VVEILQPWHDWFVLLGGASATLLGLAFVAVSLAADNDTALSATALRVFVTPLKAVLGGALVVSSVSVAPSWTPAAYGTVILAIAAVGVWTVVNIWRGLMEHKRNHLWDGIGAVVWVWRFWIPATAVALLIGGGVEAFEHHGVAAALVATATLVLALVGIHNSWDLTLWLIMQSRKS
jgi:hypothetical protein